MADLTLTAVKLDLTLSALGLSLTLNATDGNSLTLSIFTNGTADGRVNVTGADTIREFLDDKIVPGAGLTRTILNPAAAEDLQINVVANADASIVVNDNDVQVGVLATDAQHGVRGGGTQHSLTSLTAAGFMPQSNRGATTDPGATDDSAAGYDVGSFWINTTADRVFVCVDATAAAAIWDAVDADAALSDTAPVDVTKAAAAAGAANQASRQDHKHDISTAAASAINADSSNGEGAATSLARSDHTHDVDTAGGTISTVNPGDSAAEGSGTGLSRRDHQHAVATGASTAQIDVADTAAEGVSTNLAREDHQHALPAPAAPVNVTKDTAATGVATTVARADHKHDVTTAVAVEITDTTEAEGSSTALARADHGHGHGVRGGGALHADVIAGGDDGFMTGADKTKIDGIETAAKDDQTITAGAGMTGGGTGDVTLDVTANADASIVVNANDVQVGVLATDAQHGVRGGGTQHAVAIASGAAGFLSGADKQSIDDLATDFVPQARTITAGDGMTGGGDLSADRTLDVVANADGSLVANANDIQVGVLATDAQHGVRGGGTQHADVIAGGADGFMTGADKTKLDGIPAAFSKTITLEKPTTGVDATMFYTDEAITISKMVVVIVGAGTPSATVDIRHHTDRSNAGNALITSPTASTEAGNNAESTGHVITSFDDETIPADSFVWLELDGVSDLEGDDEHVSVSLFYTED